MFSQAPRRQPVGRRDRVGLAPVDCQAIFTHLPQTHPADASCIGRSLSRSRRDRLIRALMPEQCPHDPRHLGGGRHDDGVRV